MAVREKVKQGSAAGTVLVAYDAKKRSLPVWLVRNARWAREAPLSETQRTWLEQQGFKGTARKLALLPGPDGALAGAVLGLGEERGGDPMEKAELAVGLLPGLLPAGCYHLADEPGEPELAAVAWGLGAYRFRRYKTGDREGASLPPRLKMGTGSSLTRALATIVLVGVQPSFMQVPPTCTRSIMAVFQPARAKAVDSGPPDWPAPMTIASYSITVSSLLSVMCCYYALMM